MSEEKEDILHSFTSFQISICSLCEESNMSNKYKFLLRRIRQHRSRKVFQPDNKKPNSICFPWFADLWCSLLFRLAFCFYASLAFSFVYMFTLFVRWTFLDSWHHRCCTSETVNDYRPHELETAIPCKIVEISVPREHYSRTELEREKYFCSFNERFILVNLFSLHSDSGLSRLVIFLYGN